MYALYTYTYPSYTLNTLMYAIFTPYLEIIYTLINIIFPCVSTVSHDIRAFYYNFNYKHLYLPPAYIHLLYTLCTLCI